MNRVILHVDMDAFFASVEEVDNPSLRGKPVAVAGPGQRTIITTASYAAREFGVRTGMALGQGLKLCPALVIVRCDHRKYSHVSAMIIDILESFTPLVEPYSVDEAFLDVTTDLNRFGGAETLGGRIKERIREETGLTCSVGIGPNKLLAKLVGGRRKPDGLSVLAPGDVRDLMESMPVGKLCGIGPETERRLGSMGISTCGQLGRFPLQILVREFGVLGHTLSRMGRGEEDSPVVPLGAGNEKVKSIGHSATLPRDVTDLVTARRVLLTLSEMVGRRARRHDCAGNRVTLTVRYRDFTTFSRQMTLAHPIRTTSRIYRSASAILDSVSIVRPIRLLGISLSHLRFGCLQGSLFPADREEDSLQGALDLINDRYGEFSAMYADQLPDLRGSNGIIPPSWRPRGVRRSV
ncbi:MAG: DNA polymerase IV [bacterium]|nr:MAG: DNA polymerase IV [bacterium]